MKFAKLIILCFIIILYPLSHGFSQVQRMGIPKGNYIIPADSSIRIVSYCLDFTRAQPTSKTTFKYVLRGKISTSVENEDKKLNLQDAIDKGLLNITGKIFEPEEYMELVKNSMNQPGISEEIRLQNDKIIRLWENSPIRDRKNIRTLFNLKNCINAEFFGIPESPDDILFPIIKSWDFLPDSIKSLFNDKYNHIIEPLRTQVQDVMDNIQDISSIQFINKTNSDIELTLNDDIIIGEAKEDCEFLRVILGDIKFTDQNEIWTKQNREILTILKKSNCVDEKNEDPTKRFIDAVKCYQKKNRLKPTGIIEEQTEKILNSEYKKMNE